MLNYKEEDLASAIIKNEPLKGLMLGWALELIDNSYKMTSDKKFLTDLKEKLKAGQPLDEYEQHIMVDVLLFHKKLRNL